MCTWNHILYILVWTLQISSQFPISHFSGFLEISTLDYPVMCCKHFPLPALCELCCCCILIKYSVLILFYIWFISGLLIQIFRLWNQFMKSSWRQVYSGLPSLLQNELLPVLVPLLIQTEKWNSPDLQHSLLANFYVNLFC